MKKLFALLLWSVVAQGQVQPYPGTVNQILPGTNVTISPSSGTGTVTINATGGGGSIPSTTDVLTGNGSGGAADSGIGLKYLPSLFSIYMGAGGLASASAAGQNNLTFGYGAGSNLATSGITQPQGVVAIGFDACNLCTTSRETVAIGQYALSAYTGTGNGPEDGTFVAIGSYAAQNVLAAGSGSSVAIGQKAAESATTLASSVVIGSHVDSAPSSSTNDTMIGADVMNATSGGNVVSLGNVMIGLDIANGNPSGSISYNTSIGAFSGAGITGGAQFNVFDGYQAGTQCTTCVGNVAIGEDAGSSYGSASYNTAVGAFALFSSTASYNTAVGYYASENLTTGSADTFGAYACNAIQTGQNDVCVGQSSGRNAASGVSYAVFLGYGAGFSAQGNGGTEIGYAAALYATGAANTDVGYQAGNKRTTGTNNTSLGYNVASTTCATGSNDLLLGTSNTTDCASSSESNAIHIGAGSADIIYTTGANTPSTSKTVIAGTLGTGSNTISTLPTCNSGMAGQFSYVTNGQTSPTYLGTVSTTGSTTAPVFCNGANWVYH